MAADFALCCRGAARDPEYDCREAKASVEGRLQGPPRRGVADPAGRLLLRYPLSYRDIEELFLERGLAADHSTLNRWVLAYAADRASAAGLPQAALRVDSHRRDIHQ